MANIANFVSVLLANASKSILFFICLISVSNLISNCAADKTNNDIRRTLKEFQNGEDNIEIFADNGIKTSRKTFGQLKNRVVISNGETILGRNGKICLSITFYLSIYISPLSSLVILMIFHIHIIFLRKTTMVMK